MGHRNRFLLSTTFVLISSMVALGPTTARAQSAAPEAGKAAEEPAKEAPAAKPESEKAAEPAAAKCDCPPPAPCPAPAPAPVAPAAPDIEWKAQSKGGMLISTGNAQSKNFTFGVNASRKEGNNKLALEGGLNYGTSNILVATTDAAGNTTVDRQQITATNNWAAKGRYDRFVTPNNTGFASGLAAADKIAGKTFFGGGQLGYSRQLLKDEWNILVAEIGYDFSYERYVQPGGNNTLDPVSIHSARVFVGEVLSLTKETGVTASVEALFNLNKEGKAVNASSNDARLGVDAFKDTRVNAKLGLTTNLWQSLSFGFGFTLKYDQNPAPRPMPKNAPDRFTYPLGSSMYYADKVDTLTEATLIYTFF